MTDVAVLDLTHEVADLFDAAADDIEALRPVPQGRRFRTAGSLRRIAAAIREQVPAPEPPKRWTVASGCDCQDEPDFWLYEAGKCTNARGSVRSEMQAIADALNAAEQTGDET